MMFSWDRVDHTETCWLWTGPRFSNGYGQVATGDGPRSAHRVAWQLIFGAIPDRAKVLHRCDVKLCVRPDHLFLGTHQDNMDDMKAKGRSTRGRPLSERNRAGIRAALLGHSVSPETRRLISAANLARRQPRDPVSGQWVGKL